MSRAAALMAAGSPSAAPTAASLVQQVVFEFSGPPDPNSVTANSLRVRDDDNFPVPGRYDVEVVWSNGTVFVSRGDNSGTHKKELSLWEQANLIPNDLSRDWYRQVGAGMGAALNTASGMNAYILSDRASWLKFANKGDLKLLFSGDPKLHNQYAYLPINPARHAHVKHDQVLALENWLVSEKAQSLIGEYRINGERLFVPNAQPN